MTELERYSRKLADNYPDLSPHQVLLDQIAATRQRFKRKYGAVALEEASPSRTWDGVLYEPVKS